MCHWHCVIEAVKTKVNALAKQPRVACASVLQARAVVVDMEEGVIKHMIKVCRVSMYAAIPAALKWMLV